MKLQQIPVYLFACVLAVLSGLPLHAARPLTMKLLVISGSSTESGYQSIAAVLNQVGVPYQSLMLDTESKDSSGNRLSKFAFSDTTTGNGLYQGIILADSSFTACGTSCLSAADWTTLNTYAAQFQVRVVSYYTQPEPQWGLVAADSGVNYTASNPLKVNLTSSGASVFTYLNAANPIAVAGQGSTPIKAYRAIPTAATNEITTPLLVSGPYTVAVTHTTADGREVMALTMNNASGLLHSEAFGYGILNWVTKGVFIGARKVFLNPQIDDMLLGNRLYAPTLPQCPGDDSCPTLFASGQDIQALVNWQKNLKTDPMFSTFHSTFGLNGVGTTWFAKTDPVFAAIASLGSNFTWLSHTWDHASLDCYSVNTNGTCIPATLAQSLTELNKNISVAPSLGITLDTTSMITPFGSGLTNPNFMSAAAQTGIRFIMASAPPADIQTGVVSPVNSLIYQIPRAVPNLFDDVSVPQTGVYGSWPDKYNAMFGPNGTQPTYSQNQTYSQILDHESDGIFLNEMLTYAPCLLAFHIDNSSAYDGTHSTYSDLMDATITKYKTLFTLPVLTLEMKELAPIFINRASIKTAGVTGIYTPGVSVVLKATKAATIPVTGACSQDTCGTYGGQIQDNVVFAANSTLTLSLTSTEGVTLSSVTLNPTAVTAGTSVTGTVTLSGPAPTTGATITLTSDNPAATVPNTITVGSGATTANFTVITASVSAVTTANVTATYSGGLKSAALTVNPAVAAAALSSLAIAPASVTGGTAATGTVTLSAAAPANGAPVVLSSNSPSVAVPASVTVPAGSKTVSFSVTTSAVSTTTAALVTATYQTVSKAAGITVNPAVTAALSSISLSTSSVTGGTSLTGTVKLTSAAPTGGAKLTLSSTNPSATVPASVTISAGSTSATFIITTKSVTATTSATIGASYNGNNQNATLSIAAAAANVTLAAVAASPATVTGGQTSTGKVTLAAPAPSGGTSIELWTTGTAAFVPANVTVAAGATSATFTITTIQVASNLQDTITAFYNGTSKTAKITVNKVP